MHSDAAIQPLNRTPSRDLASAALRTGLALAATLLLLAPALWNGFPLLQYDTGGYLARWFEGYLVPSRAVTYGLFLAAGWPLDFWPVVFLQAAAAIWVLGLILRVHGLRQRPLAWLAMLAVLVAATTLPWIASILLTDIFAGLAVLALHLLVWHAGRLNAAERIALVLLLAFAISTHSATLLLVLALSLALLAVSLCNAGLVPRIAVARAACALTLGAAMLLAANYAVAKRIAWTPGGYGIFFGRLLEDGIVTRYLNDHCPDSRLRLCPYRNELPTSADGFLWGESVFDQLGRFAGLGEEMRIIVLESLVQYPGLQIETALAAALKQLVRVETGEGVVDTIWHTYGMMEDFTPSVLPAMRAARQQHGELHFETINLVHVPVALAATALLPLLIALGFRRRRFTDIELLAVTALLAILANAFICGPLSNPHDRYGSRIVWIAPLVVALLPFRRGTSFSDPDLQDRG